MRREYFGYWKRTSGGWTNTGTASETSKTSGTFIDSRWIRPELGVREYSSGFSLTGLDVTNLAPAAAIGWGFSLRRPSTTAVLVVLADCSLERS